jgi:hypothetical protein
MSGVLQDALQNPAERERLRQLQQIEQWRRQALKAQAEAMDRAKKQAEENAQREVPAQSDDD